MAIYKHHIEYQKVTSEGDFHILYPKNTIEDVYLTSAPQSETIASKLHFFGTSDSFAVDNPLIVSCNGITEKNLVQGIHISVLFKHGVETLNNSKYRFFIKIKELNQTFEVVHNDATDANIKTLIPAMGIVDLVYYNNRFQISGNQHKSGPGNNHIPAGGKVSQILRYSADGTAKWDDERKDTTYPVASESAPGIMSTQMFTKLNGIDYNANNYIHPESSAGVVSADKVDHSGDTVNYQSISTDKYGHVTEVKNRVFNVTGFSKSDHNHDGLYASMKTASELSNRISENNTAILNTQNLANQAKYDAFVANQDLDDFKLRYKDEAITKSNIGLQSVILNNQNLANQAKHDASVANQDLNDFKKKYEDEAITKYNIGIQSVNHARTSDMADDAYWTGKLHMGWYTPDGAHAYDDFIDGDTISDENLGKGFQTLFHTLDGKECIYYSDDVYRHLHDTISNHLYAVHLIYDTARITPTDSSTIDIKVTGDVINNHTGITSGFSASHNFDKVKEGDCLISSNAYFYELGESIKYGIYADAILEQYHAYPAVAIWGIPDTSFGLLTVKCIYRDYDNEGTMKGTITTSRIYIGVDLLFYRP